MPALDSSEPIVTKAMVAAGLSQLPKRLDLLDDSYGTLLSLAD
jgi:hypothetical protein